MDGTNAAERNKRYVLLVDNNVDDRFQTSMVLQRLGYNICTARTADEAIEFMHVAPPAAVVAEAGHTGSNLLIRLKKDPRFSGVPVITLRKPVDVEELYRAVQSNVEKTPRRNIRIDTSLDATMGDVAGGTKGCVTVISEYGMFIRTKEPHTLNARVPVRIELMGRTIKLEAVVLYSYSLEASPFNEPGMGVKFVKISPDDQAFIKAYILDQVREGISLQGPQA